MSITDGVSFRFLPPVICCKLYTKGEQSFKKMYELPQNSRRQNGDLKISEYR
jgi:hypothetical protein